MNIDNASTLTPRPGKNMINPNRLKKKGVGPGVGTGLSTGAGLSKRMNEELSDMLEADDFSIANYLNKALSIPEKTSASKKKEMKSPIDDNDIEVERLMAKVALQLQLETQSCHDEIGRIGAELQAILPRCSTDIQRLSVGLDGMKDDTQALVSNYQLEEEMNREQKETMNTLSTLHALQMNLQFTKSILEATSSWDTTLSSIPSLLSNQKLSESVTALTQLQQGARALRGMPGKDQREETIQKFKTQIETLLKPQLLHAFANIETRINLLHQSYDMYKQLGNLDHFILEYVKHRPAKLHNGWFAFTPTISSDTNERAVTDYNNKKDSNPFLVFLPQWYESILTLLSEERRRTRTVFGIETAPNVTVQILRETFRPILSSFSSRLSSIYSCDEHENKNVNDFSRSSTTLSYAGSLQTICDVYEATLQFLSMSYDHISKTQSLETNAFEKEAKMKEQVFHHEITKDTFITIASPFVPYQKSYAKLEFQNSSVLLGKIAKDLHEAVRLFTGPSAGNTSLSQLQEAIEQLENLTPLVFSRVNDTITRFELFNCGYDASAALSTIDKLLSNHTSEVSIAISTLSTSMISDKDSLADAFDEQHVQCALEVLKITGSYKQQMKVFETNVKAKLKALIPKIQTLLSTDIFKSETMSAEELGTLLSDFVHCSKDEKRGSSFSTRTTLDQLQKLSDNSTSLNTKMEQIFPSAHDSITRLANTCHTFVYDICAAVPKKFLRSMASLPVWRKEASDQQKSSSGFDYNTPTSILPQSYITNVGEHMLALVQALEPFASSSDALQKANHIMSDELILVAIQPWREFIDATYLLLGKQLDIANVEKIVNILIKEKSFKGHFSPAWEKFNVDFPNIPILEDDEHEDLDEFEKASTAFCNKWLDIFSIAITGRILERIMRIHNLSDLGAKHLATDLNYLLNVFSALGIVGHAHTLLKHIELLVSMKVEDLTNRVVLARAIKQEIEKKNTKDKETDLEHLIWGVEEWIASMRAALP